MRYEMVVTVNWPDRTEEVLFKHENEQAVRTTIKRFMRNCDDATSFMFTVVCHTQAGEEND